MTAGGGVCTSGGTTIDTAVQTGDTWYQFQLEHTRLLATIINGSPWFLASDVAAALQYQRVGDMLRLVDDPKMRTTVTMDTPGGRQDKVALSEPALYRILTRAERPAARRFQDWVFETVLPEIRRTGAYQSQLPDRRALAQMVLAAEDAAQAARNSVEALVPSAGTWDHCATERSSWTVGYAVRILRRDPALRGTLTPIREGRQRLLEAMYRVGFTNHDGSDWVANPPALRSGKIEVDEGALRITPAGLAVLHRELGGSQPLNTSPGQDLDTA